VILEFYCHDPGLKNEKAAKLRVSGDSIATALRQLLSEDLQFIFLNREGKPTENGKDIAAVKIHPKGCAGMDSPVRILPPKGTVPC